MRRVVVKGFVSNKRILSVSELVLGAQYRYVTKKLQYDDRSPYNEIVTYIGLSDYHSDYGKPEIRFADGRTTVTVARCLHEI